MEAELKTLLDADNGVGGVATLLTGGIYTRIGVGEAGINSSTAPDAFNATTGLVQPCALIVDPGEEPDGQIADQGAQLRSVSTTVRIYLYDDGTSDRSTLEAVESRLFTLLEGVVVDSRMLFFAGAPKTRERAMRNAHLIRVSYQARGVKG